MATSQSTQQQLVAQSVDPKEVLCEVAEFLEALPLFAGATDMEVLCSLGDHDLSLVLKLGLIERYEETSEECDEKVQSLWSLARRFRRVSFCTNSFVSGAEMRGQVNLIGVDSIPFDGVSVSRVQDLFSTVKSDPSGLKKAKLVELLVEYQKPFELAREED